MVALYEDWVRQYPIISIEDGLAEGDWDGWKTLTHALGDARAARRRRRVRHQPGDPAARHRRSTSATRCWSSSIRSAPSPKRSTPSPWRATPATPASSRTAPARPRTRRSPTSPSAPAPGQIKTGSASRTDRVAKYNQLLRIEEELGVARDATPGAIGDSCSSDAIREFGSSSFANTSFMSTLVLLRHGESTWNKENRFTGWTDVDLTEQGTRGSARGRPAAERRRLRRSISRYTSVLKRAIRTLWIALDEMDLMWIPVTKQLAAERAPLRRAAGTEQGGNRGEARRGAGQDLAPQLRHSAAAADARTIQRYPGARSALRALDAAETPADRVAERHGRALPARTGTRRSRRRSRAASAC